MLPPHLVKARVIDITKPGAPLPRQAVIDASVLYFTYYPNFGQLAAAGGKSPKGYQTSRYPAWIKQALKAGSQLFATPVTLGEFVRAMEYAQLEMIWRNDPATPAGEDFSPAKCKQARYTYAAQLSRSRQDAISFLVQARKSLRLLPQFKNETDQLDQAVNEWKSSTGDFADALMVANAKYAMVKDLLADDIDLLSFDGITVYTANRTSLQDASAAGKLAN